MPPAPKALEMSDKLIDAQGQARSTFDAGNRGHAIRGTQTVTGIVAGENGNVGAGTAIDLFGARSAVDRVVAISALNVISAAAGVENIVAGAAIDAVIAVAAQDDVVAPVSGDAVVSGAAIDVIGAPQTARDDVVAVAAVQLGGGAAVAHRNGVVAAQTVDDVMADDRPGQNVIALRAVESRRIDSAVEREAQRRRAGVAGQVGLESG